MRQGVARAIGLAAAIPVAFLLFVAASPTIHGVDPRSATGIRNTIFAALWATAAGAASRFLPDPGAKLASQTIVILIGGVGSLGLLERAYSRSMEIHIPMVLALVIAPAVILGYLLGGRIRSNRERPTISDSRT